MDINLLSTGALSFMGDAVYTLFVREMLANKNLSLKELNRTSAEYVSAVKQAQAYEKIKPYLSEAENAVFHRGRNFHTNNVPKSATAAEYHKASGLECVFGYLYLTGNTPRARELFEIIVKEKDVL